MKKFDLGGIWNICGAGFEVQGKVPGSVYSNLLANGLIEDPFYRDNETPALELMDNEFVFTKTFNYVKNGNNISLVCEGIDTLCDLYLNEKLISRVDNMHRTYVFNVTEMLIDGENTIKAVFPSMDKYIKERFAERNLIGSCHTLQGSMYIRKAHYMLGWDWGPRLPDAGIWKDIYLRDEGAAYITEFEIIQRHENEKVFVTAKVSSNIDCVKRITVIAPSGDGLMLESGIETEIKNPELWWPNGLGKQALYTVKAELLVSDSVVDEQTKKIGLRTLKLIREPDQYGESFCHEVNGVRFFAMGADYIPSDNILSRITRERTKAIIDDCIFANYNAIRVWGGGFYPDDCFFELCDEKGIVIFFDLMFACSIYPFGEEFNANCMAEFTDNINRIKHHASLALISGNNECEEMFVGYPLEEDLIQGYIDFFERDIPNLLKELAPDIPYVPSSPSSHGSFVDASNENIGDQHYWSVWHGNLPFTEYRKHFFRYCSEFGFQSFPCLKTIESFTLPEDRNIFSRIMERHQRSWGANGKILSYLSQTYKYPADFETLLFASQLLQAEAITYGVEHMRRNRGRCMGALYWQLNDVYPAASWASVDYYGRYKALHYAAKRFYSPIFISCEETGEFSVRSDINTERCVKYETKAKLCVNNDTMCDIDGVVNYKLCHKSGKVLLSGSKEVKVPAMSVLSLEELDFNNTDVDENYFWFELVVDRKVVSDGCSIFTKPKFFAFENPNLTVERIGDEIIVKSESFAKYVEIYSPDSDFVLSDNFFHMEKGMKKVEILSGDVKTLKVRSVYDIR